MTLKEKITAALTEAMRARDDVRKVPIRLVLSAIKEAEIAQKSELSDAEVIRVVQKEVKSRLDTIADAEKANRQDLIDRAKAEMAVLEEFLPEAISEAELAAIIKETIATLGASSLADMGAVMKALMPKVQGRADGGLVSQLVRQTLQK